MANKALDLNAALSSGGLTVSGPQSYGGLSTGYGGNQVPLQAVQFGVPKSNLPDYSAINAQIQSLLNENNKLFAQLNAQPKLLPYDYNNAYSRAQSAAENKVNPYYVKQLNDFVARQGVEKARQEADTQTAIDQLTKNLATTQESNAITGQRTAQDVGTNVANLTNAADLARTQAATGFEAARAALQGNVAQSGLTTSGLGAQQLRQQAIQKNQTVAQTAQSFNVQKQAQNLLQSRTFEDIARNNTLAAESTGQQKTRASLDLARFIEDQGYQKNQTSAQLEAQRLGAVLAESKNQQALQFNDFLKTLSNPRGQDIALTRQVLGI